MNSANRHGRPRSYATAPGFVGLRESIAAGASSSSRYAGLVASYSDAMSPRARRIVTLAVLIGLVAAVFVAAVGPMQ